MKKLEGTKIYIYEGWKIVIQILFLYLQSRIKFIKESYILKIYL